MLVDVVASIPGVRAMFNEGGVALIGCNLRALMHGSKDERISGCACQHAVKGSAADGDLGPLGIERSCSQSMSDEPFVPADRFFDP